MNSRPVVGVDVVVPGGARRVRLTTPGPSMSTMQAVPTPLTHEKIMLGVPTVSRTVPVTLKLVGSRNLESVRTLIVNPLNPWDPSMLTETVTVLSCAFIEE